MSDDPTSPPPEPSEPEEKPGEGTGSDPSEERAQAVIDAAERAASEILADATQEAQRRVTEARERAEEIGRERVEMMSALSDSLLEQATTVKRQADVVIEALDRVIATLEEERDRPARPQPATPAGPAQAARPPAGRARPPPPARRSPRPPAAAGPPPPPAQPRPPAPASPPRPTPPPQPAAPDSEFRRRALDAVRARMAHSAEPQAPSPPPATPRPPAPAPTPAPRAQDPQRPPRKPVSEGTAEGARILATQMAVAGSTRAEILVRLRKEFGIEDPEPIVDGVVGGPEPR